MKSLIAKLTLLFVSLALVLVVAEVFLRLLYPTPYHGFDGTAPQRSLFQYDSLVGWHGKPGATSRFAALDFDVQITLDAAGFRNTTPPHVAGQQNILVLGDSYAWGWGVEDHEVSAARISAMSSRFNAYNLAAPGYGTDQEYLTLRRFMDEAGELRYDGVFLLFYHNDFLDVRETARYGYPKPRLVLGQDNELVIQHLPGPEPAAPVDDQAERPHERLAGRSVFQSSHLYNLTRNRLGNFRAAVTGRTATNAGMSVYDLSLTLALVEGMRAEAERHGMFFHVVLLNVGATTETARHRLEDLATGLTAGGVKHSEFRRTMLPSTDLWLDGHLSVYGQARLARHLLAVLQVMDDGD